MLQSLSVRPRAFVMQLHGQLHTDFYGHYRGLGKYCCHHIGCFQASKENKECFVLPHLCRAGGREAAAIEMCDAVKHLAI